MVPIKDWPHAPIHRINSDGIYMVTGATLHKEHLFPTTEKLEMLERELLTLAKKHEWVKHGLVRIANQYPWCSAAWFERTAAPSAVKTIYGFKIDKLNIDDDY